LSSDRFTFDGHSLVQARLKREGLSLRARVFSSVDWLGSVGCRMPRLANYVLGSFVFRSFVGKLLRIAYQRPPPRYSAVRFDRWFARHTKTGAAPRGRVVLWDDTFVRYHEPHIGVAAVKVLEAAGFDVTLPTGRKCCGRPAFSQGHLDKARELGAHNLALLSLDADNAPILFLEPSCYSMFAEDYRELRLEGAERVAARCFLFEQFIEDLLRHEPGALRFQTKGGRVIIHAHCHVKAMMAPGFMKRLASRLPERQVTLLDTGCCGMAGAFGALESKYELSLKVAEPLIQQIRGQPFGTVVVASGTSCRQQIGHLAPVRPRHMAELLAEALE
jgi:Fe-S oxidoreductase